jgi:CubicO group peptidase (beta-lactamase class C family)
MNRDFLNNLDHYIKAKQYRLVNSVIVYEHGELVFERYYNKFNADSPHALMSVWKSLLSLTLGVCLDNGIIGSVDEPISRYLPQFNKNAQAYHKHITIRHLLTMSSGIYFNPGAHYSVPMGEQMRRSADWISHIADVQAARYPGTHFQYKEWDVILLSAVIGKAVSGTAWDIAREYLYKPLGISAPDWLLTKDGVNYNADVTNGKADALTALDLAKFGLLMLNGGVWNGERLVSEGYLKDSVMPFEAGMNYGYLWWLSDKGYHGRGFGGQELNIYPDRGIVAVVQATATPRCKSYGDICEGILK